jgi:hypothetical protein
VNKALGRYDVKRQRAHRLKLNAFAFSFHQHATPTNLLASGRHITQVPTPKHHHAGEDCQAANTADNDTQFGGRRPFLRVDDGTTRERRYGRSGQGCEHQQDSNRDLPRTTAAPILLLPRVRVGRFVGIFIHVANGRTTGAQKRRLSRS